ncbi:uncharacterized protein [Centruroides vittatus]|uniref:uncharacterized protein isoform X2 n=1 Tax=Centruroides vittatus TaxID=120091 RepID=UPI003510A2E5
MYSVGFIFIVCFSLYQVSSLGIKLYSSCRKSMLDRYCALNDKISPPACARDAGFSRSLEILDNCYNAFVETGKLLSIDEKLEKVCFLNHDEYIGISNCCEYALKVDFKRGARFYNVGEHCIGIQENKEGKDCGHYTYHPTLKFYTYF